MMNLRLSPRLKDQMRPFVLTCRRFRRKEISLVDAAYGNMVSYSQFGEDAFLNALFNGKDKGYYIDIGAFHPYHISNTYLFYKKGWHGLNIEPNPDHFRLFPSHRPRDVNLQLAVSSIEQMVSFTCNGSFSGIDDDTHLYKRSDAEAKKVDVAAKTLSKILDQYLPENQSIDFLSVDCEGHDIEVINSNDWNKYRPAVVLVEDHGSSHERSPDKILSEVG